MEPSPFFAGWKYCPRCAGPLDLDGNTASCRACGGKVYANPAPTASALVLDDYGRVLLARRAADPGEGLWDLLGGFMDEGEEPLATLRRELEEETGTEIEPLEFLGGFPDRYGDWGIWTINLYWTARIMRGEPEPSDDVAAVAWFGPDDLPPKDEFAFRNTVEVLEKWQARAKSKISEK
jgi:ADP-ribose pyrophosphatase YjhB (NUDIX family)